MSDVISTVLCYSDLSMILADPYAMHTISMSAMTNIHALATGEALPRVSFIDSKITSLHEN